MDIPLALPTPESCRQPAPPQGEQAGATAAAMQAAGSGRLISLDAFRGLTILGMLLVNNTALDVATPPQFLHAAWNQGVHFADLVFPWFLLIVGVAIPFAAASFRRQGLPVWRHDLRILGRALSLVLIGCLLDSSIIKRPVLGLGVLQLIGLAYLVAALLYDLPLRRRLLVAGGLLAAHWAAIRFLPVPGVGAGVFTESQNLVYHLNQVYLAPAHLKGIISVMPTSALVLIGTAIGDLLRHQDYTPMHKAAYVLAGGLALAAGRWLWSLDLPFNKPVWTASYVLYAAGLGAVVLGGCYLLVDAQGWRRWAFPLVVCGANAIFAYAVPILVKVYVLQGWRWQLPDGSLRPLEQALMQLCFQHAGRIAGGWLYTAGYLACWWLVLLYLYRKRILLRV